jgi:beta-mannosidase
MELCGAWRAIEASDELRRVFPDPDLDDAGWAEVWVPGHWRSVPEFAAADGPLWYRRHFGTSAPIDPERRFWLQLDGVFYDGDVWLDKSYLGATEGYFFPHTYEVTEAVHRRPDHVLAVEVGCTPPSDRRAKRNLTGVFEDADYLDQDWNPGGIWRPVRLLDSGAVRIRRLRSLCVEATAERAAVELQVGLDASRATTATIVTSLSRLGGSPVAEWRAEHPLAAGVNQVDWRVTVDRPELWWPASLGDQPLYDLAVSVEVDGQSSDRRQVSTGLRQIRMRNFIASVNGERLFLKGANHGPSQRALGDATAAALERDVVLARQAGLDLLRLHGHVSRPELYEAADRHGLLLWQDLPLQRGYAGVRRQAMRQAQEAVDLLGHHPSIAVWCGHNDPAALDIAPATSGKGTTLEADALPRPRWARFAAAQTTPSINKTRLDRSVRRALEKADRSRPVVAHSGVFPHPAWGTDSHLYLGWEYGDERDLATLMARVPVLGRFVSEFGAGAVPHSAEFCEPDRWPDLDWARLARSHGFQKPLFDRYVPPAAYSCFEGWRDATQRYQATVIRFHIETLRRLKYRPTGGFCQFFLADAQPAVSCSVLDHERVPKLGYEVLAAACAPVIVVADRLAPAYMPGQALVVAIHVVSDLRTPLLGNEVRARLAWAGGARTWRFEGRVEADSCARVGTLRHTIPAEAVGGPVTLELDLEWPGGKACNRYESEVSSVTLRRSPRMGLNGRGRSNLDRGGLRPQQ